MDAYGPVEAIVWLSRLVPGALVECVACHHSTVTRVPGAGPDGGDLGVHAPCVAAAMAMCALNVDGSVDPPAPKRAPRAPVGAYARRRAVA